jgi:geranylgeranyl diphosphate synthase type I
MKAIDYLKDYAEKADRALEEYFREKEKVALKITAEEIHKTSIPNQMMGVYRDFCRGGKKIRGSLIQLGYLCTGGKKKKEIIKASIAMEIIHAYLLIHDDIMDQDALRRGKPTIHLRYRDFHQRFLKKGGSDHYGLSMAIDLGDCGAFMGMEILGRANFFPENKARAIEFFGQTLLRTAFGQGLDVTYELFDKINEEDVMRVHLNKTAHYTISGPLILGALLGGASASQIKAMEDYGIPVGIAFQLRDDELGLFSSEEILGKPIGSDVREGKITILRIKALEKANSRDRRFLEAAYGNQNLTKKEVKRVRGITTQTGAFAYSQKMAKSLVKKGKRFVSQVTSDPKLQEMLCKMADFMIEREK